MGNHNLNKNAYLQAKSFIYSDIQREINLARASEDATKKAQLQTLIDHPGGGNFISALGLLCYTEFAGKLKFKKCSCSGNFNSFFDLLGNAYKDFRKNNKVYDIFRCGLAHEYYIKENCTIYMLKGQESLGIGKEANGHYYFVVERYFEDFKKAFDKIENIIK